jgi:chorismate mutase/prephenate dehydrogenase
VDAVRESDYSLVADSPGVGAGPEGIPPGLRIMSLEELRERLNELDRRLIELIAERQSVVEQVGAFKHSEGQAIRDYAREKRVLDSARGTADALGVAPDVAEQVMRLLIKTSLTRQELERVRAEGQGDGQQALVIGGSGKMGRWFAAFLESQGYDVTVADPAGRSGGFAHIADWRTCAEAFAVTVIAAPLKVTPGILADMAERRHAGLIFDIGSLKTPLIPALRALAASGAQVTSLHPMFGPDAELLSGKHVLFLDAGNAEATRKAQRLFDATMVQQTTMALDEHDRLIAYVLGLSHALNIAFSAVLATSGESVPRLADLSSTTFDAQLEVAARVARENPQLYFEIQSLNKHGLEPLTGLQKVIQEIIDAVRDNDEQAFVELMEQGRRYMASRG